MSNTNIFDYDDLKTKALSHIRSGKPLYGIEGALGPLLKEFLEASIEVELMDIWIMSK